MFPPFCYLIFLYNLLKMFLACLLPKRARGTCEKFLFMRNPISLLLICTFLFLYFFYPIFFSRDVVYKLLYMFLAFHLPTHTRCNCKNFLLMRNPISFLLCCAFLVPLFSSPCLFSRAYLYLCSLIYSYENSSI